MIYRVTFRSLAFLLLAGLLALAVVPVAAHGDDPDPLAVTFDQNVAGQLPLDEQFHDESGQAVSLGDYFGDKPAILVMGYFECPTLCTNVVYPELAKSVKAMTRLKAGTDFNVIAVTIDEEETTAVAARTKTKFLGDVDQPGWHFLTGDKTVIAAVAKAIGFHFVYDPKIDQFAHPTGIVIISPTGKISRYFFGLEYPPLDLRLSLLDAREGRGVTVTDQILLLCYHYDPDTGRYNNVIWSVARLVGLGTMVVLGLFMWRAGRGVGR